MASESDLPSFQSRFEHLLLSPKRLFKILGKRAPWEVAYEQSEQAEARRRFLGIEEIAIDDRALKTLKRSAYLDGLNAELHAHIIFQLEKQISDIRFVAESVLGLKDGTSQLLDQLAGHEITISGLYPHAQKLKYLEDELLRRVKSSEFIRQDPEEKEFVVDSLQSALSYIGVENLKLLIPFHIMKQSLPDTSGEFSSSPTLLNHYALGVANSAMALSRFTQVKAFDAFALGMLSNLGRHAIIKLYLKAFERVHTDMLYEAHKEKQRHKHDQLLSLFPSADYLIALQQEYADGLNVALFKHLNLRKLNILASMTTFADRSKTSRNNLAGMLRQAKRYTEVRMLHEFRCLTIYDAKDELKPMRFPPGSMDVLKSTNIFKLPLNLKRTFINAVDL